MHVCPLDLAWYGMEAAWTLSSGARMSACAVRRELAKVTGLHLLRCHSSFRRIAGAIANSSMPTINSQNRIFKYTVSERRLMATPSLRRYGEPRIHTYLVLLLLLRGSDYPGSAQPTAAWRRNPEIQSNLCRCGSCTGTRPCFAIGCQSFGEHRMDVSLDPGPTK